jgi:tetrapyrrole methylase family protein/MazG family protein
MASENREYFHKLVELMALLRSPEGCPWDKEQTRETLKPMLVEEAYEVLEALDGEAPQELCDELGDLLFQIVFHGRLAEEKKEFDVYDVCRSVYEKMVRRHPHVFGEASFENSKELLSQWEEIKAQEAAEKGGSTERRSALSATPGRLPAVYTAYQVSAKAARVGFDWPTLEEIREKFLEEFQELQEAIQENDSLKVKEEVGDLLFVVLNIARYLQVDPETALSQTNRKFIDRFQAMERTFAEAGRPLRTVRLEEMESQWQRQKEAERKTHGRSPGPSREEL